MLAEAVNPPENFLASANDDVNAPHRPLSVTVYIGEYRITRLKQLLSQKKNFTMEGKLYDLQLHTSLLHVLLG